MVAGEPRVSGLRSSASVALERTKLNYLFVRPFWSRPILRSIPDLHVAAVDILLRGFQRLGVRIGVDWFVRGDAIVSINQVRSINRRDCLTCLEDNAQENGVRGKAAMRYSNGTLKEQTRSRHTGAVPCCTQKVSYPNRATAAYEPLSTTAPDWVSRVRTNRSAF
jgi:hypothetical protein